MFDYNVKVTVDISSTNSNRQSESEEEHVVKSIPLQVRVSPLDRKITLSGDLEDSQAVREELQEKLLIASGTEEAWLVDGTSMRLDPNGVVVWSNLVCELMCDCYLTYAPSQLAMVLQYDESYEHPRSRFLESAKTTAW